MNRVDAAIPAGAAAPYPGTSGQRHPETVIEVRGLTAGYERIPVFRDFNLTVGRGEAVGIAGPNGSGKTTLFKVILGLLPPVAGKVNVLGRDLRIGKDRSWARRQIGYVPQQATPGRLPVTVYDAVLMGRWGKGLGRFHGPRTEERSLIRAALAEVGLAHKERADCRKLSGGEQQKIAIARALVREAAILLLDEPTTYLDPSARREITEQIVRLREERRLSLVVISHDPAHLERMTDRIHPMKGG